MKHIKIMFFAVLFTLVTAIASFAYSPNWYQEGDHWKIRDNNRNVLTDTLLCDDDKWFVLDHDGNMVVCGLVQNNEGKYYSLETSAGKNYGALRCISGYYDGIYLEIDPASGIIKNQDGVMALKNSGHEVFYINHNNIIYASSFMPQQAQTNFFSNSTSQDDDWEEYDLSVANAMEIMRSQHIGMFLKGEELKSLIEQALAELDSYGIQFDNELIPIISGPLGKIIIDPLGSHMDCCLIDAATGEQLPRLHKVKTPKNIRKAIYKLLK